jgi:membrane-associated protease RseP (regulator of RpoE activity)
MTEYQTTPLPPPPPDDLIAPPRHGRLASEIMAGGSVVEKADDELVGGWRGAAGVAGVLALIGVLGLFSVWWLVFVVGILVAIFFHELGHFTTARWTGMKATQFFIGFGPRLWSFRRGETEYGVRALPLGAFVRIVGMNNMDDVDPADEERTYRSKSFPRRLLVISAGSLMHMLIAIALLFVVYAADGEPTDQTAISELVTGGPAELAGVLPGDRYVGVDGQTERDLGEIVRDKGAGATVTVEVLRDGELRSLPVVIGTATDPESPLFGKPYVGVSREAYIQPHSVGSAAANAVTDIFPTSWAMTKGAVKVLNPINIVTHLSGSNEDLETRPTTLVGVTSVSDDVGESRGLIGILYLLAVLNVFVGVFNMFPLLPLDGGHAAVAIYERLRERGGKRYHADVAKLMPFATAVVTLLLFMFLTGLYLDIARPIG